MGRTWLQSGLWMGLCGTLFLGCESARRRPFYEDPLLQTKKPVMGKVQNAGPDLLARTEPSPPPDPAIMVASATARAEPRPPTDPAPTGLKGKTVEARPAVGNPLEPIPGTPVSRSKSSTEAAGIPPIRRQVPETYGHASDYTWLQGVLDKHYHGHFDLRYCDASVEDKWGGKVSLMEDPRLSQFKEGDVILV
ncbi:MAG TPA: hypothetical protein VGY77_02145, partial [Gemmataceae bacterium]|nr:hypothetical protein [Gemmataceae bacterium]